MTSKKKLIALIVLGLLAAVNFLIMPYYYAGIVLLSIIALIGFSFVPAHGCGKKLKIKVSGGGNGTKAKPYEFVVRIKNESIVPVLSLNLSVITENMVTGEFQKEDITTTLGPKGKKKIWVKGSTQYAGSIRAYVDNVSVSDPMGIHQKALDFEADGNYDVFPQPVGVELSSDVFSCYNMESYRYSQKKKGNDPGEVHGIREYQRGDSPKTIHWKLSSKLGSVVVRELGFPVENDIMIMLDCNHLDSYEEADKKLNLFMSLSQELLSKGLLHSAGWFNHKENRFEKCDIRDDDELLSALSRIIKNRMVTSEESTIARFFVEDDIEKEHSQYLYVSYDNRDVERLMTYGQVRLYGQNEG